MARRTIGVMEPARMGFSAPRRESGDGGNPRCACWIDGFIVRPGCGSGRPIGPTDYGSTRPPTAGSWPVLARPSTQSRRRRWADAAGVLGDDGRLFACTADGSGRRPVAAAPGRAAAVSRAGTLLHTPEHGGSLFTGLPVAEAAGLRLEPGSPTTMFDDDVGTCPGSPTPPR